MRTVPSPTPGARSALERPDHLPGDPPAVEAAGLRHALAVERGLFKQTYERSGMDTNVKSVANAVWWLVLLRGILLAIFGIIALVSPGIALLALVWVFGLFADRKSTRLNSSHVE